MARIRLDIDVNALTAQEEVDKIKARLNSLANNNGVNGLQRQLADLLRTMQRLSSTYPKDAFTSLLSDTRATYNAVTELNKALGEDNILTEEQTRLYTRLSAETQQHATSLAVVREGYQQTLNAAKANAQALKEEAQADREAAQAEKARETALNTATKAADDFNLATLRMLRSLKQQKGNYAEGTFGKLENTINQARHSMTELSTAYEQGKLTEEGYASGAQALSSNLKALQISFEGLFLGAQKANEALMTYEQAQSQVNGLQRHSASLLGNIRSREKNYASGTFATPKNDLLRLRADLEGFYQSLEIGKPLTQQQATQLEVLETRLQRYDKAVQDATINNKSFHGGLRDIVTGFLKFQLSATLVMQPLQKIREATRSLNETLVKTENTVISLRRVLNDDSLSNSQLSGEIYRIAEQYGQTFENVSEISTNFARTGMDWQDTIKATEAAVLALNVAELDATQASDGLIAIMTQFHLSAEDLTGVIDKLNKTADNFPVTTGKLLAALQRTGSAADNANISLDKTVGVITALSKATGRSGENLGTAVNSLIQYTQKGKALDLFASLNGDTANAVEQYKSGAVDLIEVWREVAKVIDSADERQQQILSDISNSDEIKNLSEEVHDELGDIYEVTSDVYGTANTFRKNYFIALLKNIATIDEATEVSASAQGYSIKENETYLESYTAKANTLKSTWEEIANDEQGLLALRKGMVEFATDILNVTQQVGGLKTYLIEIGAVVAAYNAVFNFSKIIGGFSKMGKAIASVKDVLTLATTAERLRTEATEAARLADEAEATAIGIKNGTIVSETTVEEANATAISLRTAATEAGTKADEAAAAAATAKHIAMAAALVVIIGTTIAIGKYKQSLEDEAKAAQEVAEKSSEAAQKYQDFMRDSQRTKKSASDLRTAFEEQAKALGYTSQEVETLITKYHGLQGAMEGLAVDAFNKKLADAQEAIRATYDEFTSFSGTKEFDPFTSEHTVKFALQPAEVNAIKGEAKKLLDEIDEIEREYDYKIYSMSSDDLVKRWKLMQKLYEQLKKDATADEGLYDNAVYKTVKRNIEGSTEQMEKLIKATTQAEEATQSLAEVYTQQFANKNPLTNGEEVQALRDYADGLKNSGRITDEIKKKIYELADSYDRENAAISRLSQELNLNEEEQKSLRQASEELRREGYNLEEVTIQEIAQLAREGKISLETANKLLKLKLATIDVSTAAGRANLQGFINQIISMGAASDASIAKLSALASVMSRISVDDNGSISWKIPTDGTPVPSDDYLISQYPNAFKYSGNKLTVDIQSLYQSAYDEAMKSQLSAVTGDTDSSVPTDTDTEKGGKDNAADWYDDTQAIINNIQARHNLLEVTGKQIEREKSLAESMGHNSAILEASNRLIDNKKSRINALTEANGRLLAKMQEVDASTGFDVASWFDINGNETIAYANVMNSTGSKDAQDKIKDIFTSYGDYVKQYKENIETINALTDEINTKASWESPTEAIIRRIQLKSDLLEKDEEEIEKNLDLAESEERYADAMTETNKLLQKRKERISAVKQANKELHNEAGYIRKTYSQYDTEPWFDDNAEATEAYIDLLNSGITPEEKALIEEIFDTIQSYKKRWLDNEELLKEIETAELADKILELARDIRNQELQKEIDALEKAKDIENDQLTIEEKKLAVLQAQQALIDAQNQRNVRVYNADTGRWEWQANKKTVEDAREALRSAKIDLQDAKDTAKINSIKRKQDENEAVWQRIISGEATPAEIAAMMEENSANWHISSLADKSYLSSLNQALGAKIGATYDNGKWFTDDSLTTRLFGVPYTNASLTNKLLTPNSQASYQSYADRVHALFGDSSEIAKLLIETIGRGQSNEDNRTYNLNGVPITQKDAENYTVMELFQKMDLFNKGE